MSVQSITLHKLIPKKYFSVCNGLGGRFGPEKIFSPPPGPHDTLPAPVCTTPPPLLGNPPPPSIAKKSPPVFALDSSSFSPPPKQKKK